MLLSVFMQIRVHFIKKEETSDPVLSRYYNWLIYFIIMYQCKSWYYRQNTRLLPHKMKRSCHPMASWVFIQVQFSVWNTHRIKIHPTLTTRATKPLSDLCVVMFSGCEWVLMKKDFFLVCFLQLKSKGVWGNWRPFFLVWISAQTKP